MSTTETSNLTPEQIRVRNDTAVTDTILFMSDMLPQIEQDMQKLLIGAVNKEVLLEKIFGSGIDQQKLVDIIQKLEKLTTESEVAQQRVRGFDAKNEIYNEYLPKKAALLDELSQITQGFASFRNSYGDEYAINFLKVVRDLKETSDMEVKEVIAKRLSSFTAEDLNAITEHWLCKRPACFMNLLHKYPGVLSAIRIFALNQSESVDSFLEAENQVCNIQRPIELSAEYIARHADADIKDKQTRAAFIDFLQARSNVVTGLFGMLDTLAQQRKLDQYKSDSGNTVFLSDTKVAEEQQIRTKLQTQENKSKVIELYSLLIVDEIEEFAESIKNAKTEEAKIGLCEKKAELQLRLAILKGEDSVYVTQKADTPDVECQVLSRVGFKPSQLNPSLRLQVLEFDEAADMKVAAQESLGLGEKKRSRSLDDLRLFVNKSGEQSSANKRKRSASATAVKRIDEKEKTPDEIKLELIELTKKRINSLNFPTEENLGLLITEKDLERKIEKFNRYNQILSILEGNEFYNAKFKTKDKVHSSQWVTNSEQSPATIATIDRLNLAASLVNDKDGQVILVEQPPKKQNKIISKAKEIFFRAVEHILGRKLEPKLPGFLVSGDTLFREAFNKLWQKPTVESQKQPPISGLPVAGTKTKLDAHAAARAVGMFPQPNLVVRGLLDKESVKPVQGISPAA